MYVCMYVCMYVIVPATPMIYHHSTRISAFRYALESVSRCTYEMVRQYPIMYNYYSNDV
jgi:hypothetical protein